ncbi:b9c52581-77ad-4055-957e-2b75baf17bcb [Sclerotinia trifoliorum]|uniref:B9c52581-77ad-4055-957e-2b75baf17bcb n=1 Tax=Sclerotinia trifoliorum TaxID=28548 RepID=A0A8H2VTI8_9HELO|nr:b9c52581-77ad-4055-957e-2b75baf17bcb [Sclerotinia trifoliorum]
MAMTFSSEFTLAGSTATSKKTRACRQKSKTGCTTCKIRRVKCDETKPSCMRCKNFGRKCDGYEYNPKDKPAWLMGPTISTGISQEVIETPSVAIPPTISVIDFGNEQEAQYFDFFCKETVFELAGGSEKKLFNVIILQACHTDTSVRHAVTAIAALSKAMKASKYLDQSEGEAGFQRISDQVEMHHRYALKQYGKSLRYLRNLVQTSQNFLRIPLLVSLIIFCFENFHGNTQLADKHIYSALKMMHHHEAFSSHPCHNLLLSSPAPDLVENEIVTAYLHLALAIVTRPDDPDSLSRKVLDLISVDIPPPNIPQQLCNLEEAEIHLEHVLYHSLPSIPRADLEKRLASPALSPKGLATSFSKLQRLHLEASSPILTGFEFPMFSSIFQDWQRAFQPIISYAQSRLGNAHYVAATTLHIKALGIELMGQGVFLDYRISDHFLPIFRQIISLSQKLVSDPRFLKTFVFDAGIIPSLFVVIYACPDQNIRKDAVMILKEAAPRREGTWDALKIATIGQMLLESEEVGPIITKLTFSPLDDINVMLPTSYDEIETPIIQSPRPRRRSLLVSPPLWQRGPERGFGIDIS